MKNWFVWALAALLVHGSFAEKPQVRAAKEHNYDAADLNADGKIACWELLAYEKSQARKKGESFDIESARELFALLDTDHSKSISRDEFKFLNHYSSLPEQVADSGR